MGDLEQARKLEQGSAEAEPSQEQTLTSNTDTSSTLDSASFSLDRTELVKAESSKELQSNRSKERNLRSRLRAKSTKNSAGLTKKKTPKRATQSPVEGQTSLDMFITFIAEKLRAFIDGLLQRLERKTQRGQDIIIKTDEEKEEELELAMLEIAREKRRKIEKEKARVEDLS